MSAPPHLRVACAVIERGGAILAARRGAAMSQPRKWEFPGGKIRDGESTEECLRRELREELGIAVRVLGALAPTTHRYPGLTVTLHPLRCEVTAGRLTLHEHEAVRWLPPAELRTLDWAEADLPVVEACIAARAPGGGGR